jgi:DNA-binding response OmpR family regulator
VILLVEDDAELRSLSGSELRQRGFSVIEVASATDALGWLVASLIDPHALSLPDLVISDVQLPDLSGLELLDIVRERADPPPMLLITAFPSEVLVATALARGACAILAKPFSAAELLTAVHWALGSGPRRAQPRS